MRRLLVFAGLAGLGYLIYRIISEPEPEPDLEREAAPVRTRVVEPGVPVEPGPGLETGAAWVEPTDGACPSTHPVKAKLSTGIYHLPGGRHYERTRPDRCYRDAEAAERDGLRRSRQ